MKCEVCGAAYDSGDKFCRNCGLRFDNAMPGGEPSPEGTAARPVRRRGCSALLLAACVCIVLFALLANFLAQIAPDILKLAGFKPKDLGVKWSEADYLSLVQKCGVLEEAPPQSADRNAYDIEFSGGQDVDWTLTDSEITAWLNTGRPGWWPFADAQFRIHAGDTIEVSFTLNTPKLMKNKDVTAYMPPEVKSYLAGVTMSIPIYASAKIEFTGPKQVRVQVISCTALGLSLMDFAPGVQVDKILEDIVNAGLAKAEPVEVESFTTGEGSLHLEGKWYEEMKRVPVGKP
jgi:hypothetical protein